MSPEEGRKEAPEPVDPEITRALSTPAGYPHDASAREGIQEIHTHISHVFLTGERVYKLKKSVDVGFVSFVRQEARNRDCLREVALNRRLAPDVYLGVAPIERGGSGFAVGEIDPEPEALGTLGSGEHCVVMRRLPAGRDALSLLEEDRLPVAWLRSTADTLAAFHAEHGLGRPAPFSRDAWKERIWSPVAANFESLDRSRRDPLDPAAIAALRDAATAAFEMLQPAFEARRLAGRGVDGHGDLHLEHVWFEADDGVPLVIDCLEFSDELRQVDAASEVAFLAMDLAYRGRADLAEQFLAGYARAADDYDLYRVVDFFVSYRAAVRGKVESLEASDPEIPEDEREAHAHEARRRVAFATAALETRAPGAVYLVGGLIGAGKSTVARALSEATGAPIVSSDTVRRHEAAHDANGGDADPDGWQEGRYAPGATARIYDRMFERADAVLGSGRSVVLDASWASSERRARAREWAKARDARSVVVEVRCGREETLRRLAARRREGRDDSEAGPEIYDEFAGSFEAITEEEWPGDAHLVLQTDREGWREALVSLVQHRRR